MWLSRKQTESRVTSRNLMLYETFFRAVDIFLELDFYLWMGKQYKEKIKRAVIHQNNMGLLIAKRPLYCKNSKFALELMFGLADHDIR